MKTDFLESKALMRISGNSTDAGAAFHGESLPLQKSWVSQVPRLCE